MGNKNSKEAKKGSTDVFRIETNRDGKSDYPARKTGRRSDLKAPELSAQVEKEE